MKIILLVLILLVSFITGSSAEDTHYKKIKIRENAFRKQPIFTYGAENWDTSKKITKVELVSGEVVVSVDFFSAFVACIKNMFGGELSSIISVLDRGKREAILRMREKARGADIIVNTKIEQIMLDANPANSSKCALIAYGTAITYE